MLRDKLHTFADDLEGRDKTLFYERWLTDSPKTLQVLGDTFGVSRERTRQLEKRLLSRLKEYLQTELGSAVELAARA